MTYYMLEIKYTQSFHQSDLEIKVDDSNHLYEIYYHNVFEIS